MKKTENNWDRYRIVEPQPKPVSELQKQINESGYNSATAVSELRRNGYRVVLRHLRKSVPTDNQEPLPLLTKINIPENYEILPTGGMTQLDITDPFGERVTSGAVCSDSDNYWCEGGRFIALERAFEKLRNNQRSAQLLKKILKNAK